MPELELNQEIVLRAVQATIQPFGQVDGFLGVRVLPGGHLNLSGLCAWLSRRWPQLMTLAQALNHSKHIDEQYEFVQRQAQYLVLLGQKYLRELV